MSPNSQEPNSKSTSSSTTSKEASKEDKLQKRASDAYAQKLAILEGYKQILKVIEFAEKYYEKPLQNGIQKKPRLEPIMLLEPNKDYLGSKKIYKNLPNINNNMTNEQINAIIKKRKTKMKQGVLRGKFKNFREKTAELESLQKQKVSITKQRGDLKNIRNYLLAKHSNLDHFKDADWTIQQFLKKIVKLKESLKKYENTTQNMIQKKKERNEARGKKQKAKENLKTEAKARKQSKAKRNKLARQKTKESEKAERQKAKVNEKAERQKAKDAETERKKKKKKEIREAKEAIKQAAILTAAIQMTYK